jgi:hypothetical protein
MMKCWDQLVCDDISIRLKATSFHGNVPVGCLESQARGDGEMMLSGNSAVWRCMLSLDAKSAGVIDAEATFRLDKGEEPCGNVSVSLAFGHWTGQNYVLMPAAAYNGNRFRIVPEQYPPFFRDQDGIVQGMPVTITDVPHLNLGDGPSQIHLRSGDMATPCAGVWMPSSKKGYLLLFEHITPLGYTGVKLTESGDRKSAVLDLEAPAIRQTKYTMGCARSPSDDAGVKFRAGDSLTLRFRIVIFDCADVTALFDAFFEHRKDMSGSCRMVHGLPFSAAYKIIEKKYNETQFNEAYGYYRIGPKDRPSKYCDWQAGWVGGGMNSLALLFDGCALSRERANRTMDALFGALQNKMGFVFPILYRGERLGDDFHRQQNIGVSLVRRQADVLVFASRHILLARKRGESVPKAWLDGLRALADGLVRLWDRHGQFGQFIDIETGEMVTGGTAAGSMAPGGLMLAWHILGDDACKRVAEASAKFYYLNFVRKGLLNGGPGEILQCPDSESASNMLESFVILYETTGNRGWLLPAADTAAICSSWCVSYDFTFPAESEFGKLGMRTMGSVYANTQNKHAAPGFCTLSGASLLRLYRATGDRRYLDLCRDTAHNITQYLSREDRPITSWNGETLQPGWMCERVNMCDWEGKEHVGGVYRGTDWCEVSCLLTYAEVPGILFLADTGEAIALDHVDTAVSDAGYAWLLRIHNPTRYDADIKLLFDSRRDFSKPWSQCVMDDCRHVKISAYSDAMIQVPKSTTVQTQDCGHGACIEDTPNNIKN